MKFVILILVTIPVVGLSETSIPTDQWGNPYCRQVCTNWKTRHLCLGFKVSSKEFDEIEKLNRQLDLFLNTGHNPASLTGLGFQYDYPARRIDGEVEYDQYQIPHTYRYSFFGKTALRITGIDQDLWDKEYYIGERKTLSYHRLSPWLEVYYFGASAKNLNEFQTKGCLFIVK